MLKNRKKTLSSVHAITTGISEKLKKPAVKKTMTIVILCLIALFIAERSPQGLFHHGQTDIDQSVFQHVANTIKNGGMPYRDTFDHKGPLIYIIYFLGSSIDAIHGVWLFELAAVIITVFSLYKIAKLTKCSNSAAIIATIIAVTPWIGNFYDPAMTEEFALPFCAVSLFIFLDLLINDKLTTFRSILCGFCLGGVLMLRPNMIAVWIVFSIAAFVYYIKRKQFKTLLKTISLFLFGITTFIGPILIWLIGNGSLNDFISQYIIFNSEYTKYQLGTTSIFTALSFFLVPIVFYSTVALIYYFVKHRSLVNGALVFYMFISLILTAISRRLFPHYGIILIPTLIYPSAELSKSLFMDYKKAPTAMKTIIVTAFIGLILIPWAHSGGSIIKSISFSHYTKYDTDTATIINYLKDNSAQTDTIAIYGNSNIIYNETGLRAASKYSYTSPIDSVDITIKDSYLTDWKKSKPRFVIITKKPSDEVLDFLEKNLYTIALKINSNKLIYQLEL